MLRAGPLLVGVDADERSREALKEATALGAALGRPVHVVHALEVSYAYTSAGAAYEFEWRSAQMRALYLGWTEEARSRGVALPPLTVVRGHPVRVLRERAEDEDAAMLIVGAHAPRRLDLIGAGTAGRLLRATARPVMVRRTLRRPGGPILVPVDLSDESEAALEYGAFLAGLWSAPLITLMVHPEPARAGFAGPEALASSLSDERARGAAVYRDLVARRTGAAKPRALEDRGDPRLRIAAVAEREGVDLVVMGTRGRTGLARWSVGSVTEHVLRRTSLSLLAVRAREREYLLDPEVASIGA